MIPEALISITEAREYMGDAEADSDRLEDLIGAYSLAIKGYTQRQFHAEDAVAKTFGYYGSGLLDLAPYELRSASGIIVGGVTVAVDTDVQLVPAGMTPQNTYVALWFAAPYGDLSTFGLPRQRFGYTTQITGDWGMAEIPEPAKMACKIAVADAYRNPEGYSRRSNLGVIGEEATPSAGEQSLELPDDAKGMLDDAGLTRWSPLLAP